MKQASLVALSLLSSEAKLSEIKLSKTKKTFDTKLKISNINSKLNYSDNTHILADDRKKRKVGTIDFSNFENLQGNGSEEMFQRTFKNIRGTSRPLVRGDSSIDVANYLNLQYTGPAYFGSELDRLDLIYDTGSDWLVVDTDNCQSCHAPVFDTSASDTYTVTNTTLSTLVYGSASVKGYYSQDFVSLDTDASTHVAGMEFFALAS